MNTARKEKKPPGSKYECTLSNFYSYAEDDLANGTPFNGTMEIESVSLINDEFKFTSGSTSKDYCTFNTAEQLNQDNASKTSIKDLSKYFMPLNNLQLELQSPDQVRSIVKPSKTVLFSLGSIHIKQE